MDGTESQLELPEADRWRRLGVTLGAELHEGHQSRVFTAHVEAASVVVKLIDARHADEATPKRIELSAELAAIDERVAGPTPLDGSLVNEIDGWWVTASPHVAGRRPNTTDRIDVTTMATGLARLHRSLAAVAESSVAAKSIPPVRALRGVDLAAHGFGPSQLLHGDYSNVNLLIGDDRLHILDFDDCGYGPVEFEIGNTLYMVLFDATLHDRLTEYEQFRGWFIAAYEHASGRTLDPAAVETALDLRTNALRGWLDDLSTAPAGVRNSSPEWLAHLRSFVDGRRGLQLRDFRPADQSGFRALVLDGLRERWADAFDPDANPDLDDLDSTYVAHDASVVVAEEGGQLIGTGILVPDGRSEARVVRMSVAASHRRRGVGRLIVAALLERAASQGCARVHVSTDTPWHSAQELYRSCGFVEVGHDATDTHFTREL